MRHDMSIQSTTFFFFTQPFQRGVIIGVRIVVFCGHLESTRIYRLYVATVRVKLPNKQTVN